MLRTIIQIDEQKCNGCGLCAAACHEGAIAMVNGKARLIADDYCDGLGDCLPACPTGAISFVEREAKAYDAAAVKRRQHERQTGTLPCGCPGSQMRQLKREEAPAGHAARAGHIPSELRQWPVQIKLAPVNAAFYAGADLLIAADCAAYAYANLHQDFLRGKITLIGCPKLDQTDYSEKLAAIISENEINSVSVVRMQVPCCGLDRVVRDALETSGKNLPLNIAVISTDGQIVSTTGAISAPGAEEKK